MQPVQLDVAVVPLPVVAWPELRLSPHARLKIATAGNARTTVSARNGLADAFNVAINAGAVMGFALVSLATLGLILIYGTVDMTSMVNQQSGLLLGFLPDPSSTLRVAGSLALGWWR